MPIFMFNVPQYKWTFPRSEPNQKINPIQKWRKVPCCNTNTFTQEIFKEKQCLDNAGKNLRCVHRIRTMQNKNGVFDFDKNYNYKQYLQKRCKTYYQNTFNFSKEGTETRCNCPKCKIVTYKPNKHVTSSTRLLRLKNNAINLNKKTIVTKKKYPCKKASRHGCCREKLFRC